MGYGREILDQIPVFCTSGRYLYLLHELCVFSLSVKAGLSEVVCLGRSKSWIRGVCGGWVVGEQSCNLDGSGSRSQYFINGLHASLEYRAEEAWGGVFRRLWVVHGVDSSVPLDELLRFWWASLASLASGHAYHMGRTSLLKTQWSTGR